MAEALLQAITMALQFLAIKKRVMRREYSRIVALLLSP
jgi:hypothetical protein